MQSISVVIPTHNRLPVLLEALRCLAGGSEMPDEVIVVDDGSEEPVQPAVEAADFGFPSLRVIRFSPGRGAPVARNEGARASTGDIVVFMDDDLLPDVNMVRYHRRIHEAHPAPNYGVMARIYFDPDLPRTPLMHYIEEYGYFTAVSKDPDRTPVLDGLISANFSMKRAFMEGRSKLFDENFPHNRNEDTEFGVRMVAEGWDLHYHIAPSSRHHSPLDLDTFFRQVRQGGFSKAYWSLAAPDDTGFCLCLGECAKRKLREVEITALIGQYREAFGEALITGDMDHCSPVEFDNFRFFVRNAMAWVQDIGQMDGWCERVPVVRDMLDDLAEAFDAKDTDERLTHLTRAHDRDPAFLPMAVLLSDELGGAGYLEEARKALVPVAGSLWVKLRMAELAEALGDLETCWRNARMVYDGTAGGNGVQWEQRRRASEILTRLEATDCFDIAWARSVWTALGARDFTYNRQWVYTLHRALKRRGLLPENETVSGLLERMSGIHTCNKVLKALNGAAEYKAPQRITPSVTPPPPLRPERAVDKVIGKRLAGEVTWFTPEKRFGFVRMDGTDLIAFVHYRHVKVPRFAYFEPGQRLTFTVHETTIGLEARDIRPEEGPESNGNAGPTA